MPSEPSKPRRRPRKRNGKPVTPARIVEVSTLSSRGFSEAEIAREVFELSQHAWEKLKAEDERVSAAIRAGRDAEHRALFGKLYDVAVNGSGRDSVISAMFLLKSRHGYRENTPVRDDTRNIRVEVVLPGPLSSEQYEKVVQKHPKVLDVEASKE